MDNSITLNNGVEMPRIGYGVYQVAKDVCAQCVADALAVGYRMIDTAQSYANEAEVGEGIRQSGVSRGAESPVFLMQHDDPGIPLRIAVTDLPRAVSRAVVDKDDLQFSIALAEHTVQGFLKIRAHVIHRNNDADQAALSHSLFHVLFFPAVVG